MDVIIVFFNGLYMIMFHINLHYADIVTIILIVIGIPKLSSGIILKSPLSHEIIVDKYIME